MSAVLHRRHDADSIPVRMRFLSVALDSYDVNKLVTWSLVDVFRSLCVLNAHVVAIPNTDYDAELRSVDPCARDLVLSVRVLMRDYFWRATNRISPRSFETTAAVCDTFLTTHTACSAATKTVIASYVHLLQAIVCLLNW